MAEDLYAVLGLSRSATDSEIKKAYRRLARQYHPDVNKEAGAEEKFKNIQKAYTILSDSQRKAQYDQFGVADDSAAGAGGAGAGGFGGFGGFGDIDDIFDSFFGGSQRRSRSQGPSQGEDLRYDLTITLEDASKGVKRNVSISHMASCHDCAGSGSAKGSEKVTCKDCQGTGQVKFVQRTMLGSFSQVATCTSCSGRGSVIKKPCRTCSGKGVSQEKKDIELKVPAGVDTGVKLRVNGEGNQGAYGGAAGDLYVFITVQEHQFFEREEQDVRIEINLPFTQLLLGVSIDVPTLDGHATLKVPSGTQSGAVFRMKGKGLPSIRGYGKGNQYVAVKAVFPDRLSPKERQLIQEMSQLRNDEAALKTPQDLLTQRY